MHWHSNSKHSKQTALTLKKRQYDLPKRPEPLTKLLSATSKETWIFSSSLLLYGSFHVIFVYELRYTNVNILQCYLNFLSIVRSEVGIKNKLVTLVINSHQISGNKTNHVALFTEVIGIYCENSKGKHKHTLWTKCTILVTDQLNAQILVL